MQNSMYIIPFENIDSSLDYDTPKYKKYTSFTLKHKVKDQKSIIDNLLIENKKKSSEISNLYNYVLSLESHMETYRMDNMDFLLDNLNTLRENNNFLDTLILSLD